VAELRARWTVAGQDNAEYYQPGIAADGQGGRWMSATDASFTTSYLVDFQGGQFVPQAAPTEPGYTTGISRLAWVPGTTSLWATAGLSPTGDGINESAILQYGS
jgi:hypothetical protein